MGVRYQAYPEYKDSGVEWLGVVPEHWETIPVGRLFRRIKRNNHVDKELLSVYRDCGVIPKNSREDNNNKPSDDLTPYQLVKSNDLVMNKMKTWQGSIAMSEYEGIVSPAYFVYQPSSNLFKMAYPKYIHYLLRNPMYIAQYMRRSKGIRVNQWDLDPNEFQRIELLIPGKDEQSKIFQFLDHETTKIDTLIKKQQQLIKLLKEKRQAVISHAVTKGLNPDVPMKDSGVEWLGVVPENWNVTPLKHLVSKSIIDGPHESPIKCDEGIPFVSAEAIRDGEINFEKIWGYISKEDHKRFSKRFSPKKNDIFMVKLGATTGKVAIVCTNKEFNIWVPLAAIRIKKPIDAKFIFFQLQSSNVQDAIQMSWTYGTQQTLGLKTLENFRLPIPGIKEQLKIVSFLDSIIPTLEISIQKANELVTLLQERRTALISAAVTGKIDVRDWQSPVQTRINKEGNS